MIEDDSGVKPARLHELDGLRGLLALQVAMFHLMVPIAPVSNWADHFAPILKQGWYAVDVFFVMSGFVMMYVYGKAFQHGAAFVDLKKFFVARIARLYPVHVFSLALLLIGFSYKLWIDPSLTAPDGRYSWGAAVASLFMLHGPWIDHRTWNFPSWSISAEFHAYAIFPILPFLLLRAARPVAIAIVFACTIIPSVVYGTNGSPEDFPTNGPITLLIVLPLFISGAALYTIRQSPLFESGWITFIVLCATFIFLSHSDFHVLSIPIIPILILCSLHHPKMRFFLNLSPMRFLGAISYSLYMTHALIGLMLLPGMSRAIAVFSLNNLAAGFLVWIACVMLSLVLAWLTWTWIEVPARSFITERFGHLELPHRRKTAPNENG